MPNARQLLKRRMLRPVIPRVGIKTDTIFAGELSIPPWMLSVTKDVAYFFEWDPRVTKVTGVKLSWAVQTDAVGITRIRLRLNDMDVDEHLFQEPATYSKTLDISDKFFNGPNLFRFVWEKYITMPWWVNCKVRADIEISYEGIGPIEIDSTPLIIVGSMGLVIGIVAFWRRRR